MYSPDVEELHRLATAIGVKRFSPFSAHDCRHYCATLMARQGYSLDELMGWFGWTSAQTALRYIATSEVQKRSRGRK